MTVSDFLAAGPGFLQPFRGFRSLNDLLGWRGLRRLAIYSEFIRFVDFGDGLVGIERFAVLVEHEDTAGDRAVGDTIDDRDGTVFIVGLLRGAHIDRPHFHFGFVFHDDGFVSNDGNAQDGVRRGVGKIEFLGEILLNKLRQFDRPAKGGLAFLEADGEGLGVDNCIGRARN